MKIMKQVAFDFLEEKKSATFQETWDHVKIELKSDWETIYAKEKIDIDAIEKLKIGELYTMFTTDGEFVKSEKDMWTLSHFYSYEQVQKMNINVGEL